MFRFYLQEYSTKNRQVIIMSDKIIQNKSQRLLHLDLLRLLAIYLVIFNHTGDRGFMLFSNSMDSPLYFLYMMISVFCKIAVPVFFMISGTLLLPKEESLKQLFFKRIFRIVIVLILISVPYYLWLKRSNGLSISNFFSFIYGNSASTSLWYLYSYIALLLVLPFLRSMIRNMKQRDFLYLFAGHIVFIGVLPCLEYLLWHGEVTIHGSFSPVLFMSQNIFFAIMGYCLEYVFEMKSYRLRTVWIGSSIVALLITCLMTNWKMQTVRGEYGSEELEQFFNCFISVPAIVVYCFMKSIASKLHHPKIIKWISILGSAVFGVYLIEKFVRALTDIVYIMFVPFVGSMIASYLWCLAVLCVSLLIVLAMKNIPVIKKIVNKFI